MTYSHLGGDPRESFKDLENSFKMIETVMGYLPNSHLSMAKNPALNERFSALAGTIFSRKHIDMDLANLIALASSLSSGCKYLGEDKGNATFKRYTKRNAEHKFLLGRRWTVS